MVVHPSGPRSKTGCRLFEHFSPHRLATGQQRRSTGTASDRLGADVSRAGAPHPSGHERPATGSAHHPGSGCSWMPAASANRSAVGCQALVMFVESERALGVVASVFCYACL